MKKVSLIVIGAALILIALISFLGSVILISADGQGAFVFIVTIPVIFLSLLVSRYFIKKLKPALSFKFLNFLNYSVVFLISVFFIDAFIIPKQPISDFMIRQSANGFGLVMGMRPYFYFNQNRKTINALEKHFESIGDELTAQDLDIGKDWSRICFLKPYSTEEEAAKVLGYYAATMERTQTKYSDSYVALVFLSPEYTLDVLDISRGKLDFIDLASQCIAKENFPLKIIESPPSLKKVARP
jgi:hypothetical protein